MGNHVQCTEGESERSGDWPRGRESEHNPAEIHSPVVSGRRNYVSAYTEVHQPTASFLHPVSFSNTVPVGWSMVAARSNCAYCVRDTISVLCADRVLATLAVTECAPSVSSLI